MRKNKKKKKISRMRQRVRKQPEDTRFLWWWETTKTECGKKDKEKFS